MWPSTTEICCVTAVLSSQLLFCFCSIDCARLHPLWWPHEVLKIHLHKRTRKSVIIFLTFVWFGPFPDLPAYVVAVTHTKSSRLKPELGVVCCFSVPTYPWWETACFEWPYLEESWSFKRGLYIRVSHGHELCYRRLSRTTEPGSRSGTGTGMALVSGENSS